MPSFDLNIMVFDIFPFLNCQKLDLLSYRTFLFPKSKFELHTGFSQFLTDFLREDSKTEGLTLRWELCRDKILIVAGVSPSSPVKACKASCFAACRLFGRKHLYFRARVHRK